MPKRTGRPPKRILEVSRRIIEDWANRGSIGDRLPSERELSLRYGVSRPTIRGALLVLEGEKIVTRKPQAGYFLIQRPAAGGAYVGKQVGLSFAHGWNAFGGQHVHTVVNGIHTEFLSAAMTLAIPAIDWHWTKYEAAGSFFEGAHILGVLLLERHPDAVVRSLKALKKPLVAVDFDGTAAGMVSFCHDNARAGALLARRLRRLGHRNVAAIFEAPDKPFEDRDEAWCQRYEGLQAEWQDGGGPPLSLIGTERRGDLKPALGRLVELLRKPPEKRPSALVLPHSDGLQAVMEAVAGQGLRVPADLTLVGFREMLEGKSVEMTGICFDGFELGRRAAEHILLNVCGLRAPSTRSTLRTIKGRYTAGHTHARAR